MDRAAVLWLTLGGIVALGLTFALGVMVGRRAERFATPPPEAAGHPDTLAQLAEQQDLHDKLTFYSKLVEPQRPFVSPAPAPTSPVLAPERAAHAPSPSAEATPIAVATPATVPPPLGAHDGLTEALEHGPAKSGQYTVQVSSYQTIEEANAFASALRRKGLKAYVVSAEIAKKGTWHRVRIGAFVDEEQAQAAKQRLAAADIAAWVLRAE